MNRPFIQLILVQLRDFYREPSVIFWSLLFPILMAWGLGIAFNKKVEMTKTVALVIKQGTINDFKNHCKDVNFEEKSDSVTKSHYYKIPFGSENSGITVFRIKPVDWKQAELMVKRGSVSLIIESKADSLHYHFDKFNSEGQLAYLQLTSLFKGYNPDLKQAEIRPMTAKGTRYIDFLIPGLLAMNVMMSTMWGVGYTIIEARTKKLLRRMVATPMPKWEYITSLIVARVLLCFVEATIVFTFAHFYFDIIIEGSVFAFIMLFLSGIVCFSGIAVIFASRTSKTQVGNGLINLIVMPMMLLSGIYFSYHNFPDAVIPIIQALPLTMLADGVKSIFNESAGFAEVWKYIIALNAIGLTTFFIGLKIYKWY